MLMPCRCFPSEPQQVPEGAGEMARGGWLPYLNRKGADPHRDCKQTWQREEAVLPWPKPNITMSDVSTGSRKSYPGVSTFPLLLSASLGLSTVTS